MDSYFGRVYETWLCSGPLGYLMVLVWLLYPVAIVTIYHPVDAIGFQAWLQGLEIPRYMTHRMLNVGLSEALLALAALMLCHLVIVTLIFRRSQLFVQLWPLAAFLVGGIANGIWCWRTGYFDPTGAMAGLTPVLAAIVCHGVCERLGSSFIFGPSYRGA